MTPQEISDDVWSVMEPLMPTATGRSRPWTDHRLAVEGMAWKYRTGAPWRGRAGAVREVELDLQAVQRWAGNGTWEKLLAEGHPRPPPREGPAPHPPRPSPGRVLADKGYPSRANRAWPRERGI